MTGGHGFSIQSRFRGRLASPIETKLLDQRRAGRCDHLLFRSMPGSMEQLLQYRIQCNINAIELMGQPAEAYAGMPQRIASDADYFKKAADWRASAPFE